MPLYFKDGTEFKGKMPAVTGAGTAEVENTGTVYAEGYMEVS